jgi:hypothetical protein
MWITLSNNTVLRNQFSVCNVADLWALNVPNKPKHLLSTATKPYMHTHVIWPLCMAHSLCATGHADDDRHEEPKAPPETTVF